jgi:hypothetical protein
LVRWSIASLAEHVAAVLQRRDRGDQALQLRPSLTLGAHATFAIFTAILPPGTSRLTVSARSTSSRIFSFFRGTGSDPVLPCDRLGPDRDGPVPIRHVLGLGDHCHDARALDADVGLARVNAPVPRERLLPSLN